MINPDAISGNLNVGISDHLPSFVIFPKKTSLHLPKKHNLYKRSTKNLNREALNKDLNNINWDSQLKLNDNDISNSFDKFYDQVNTCIDKHAPHRKLTNKEFKLRFKPWISSGIINSIKRKHSLFNKYIHCKDPIRKVTLHKEYKTLRNHINTITNDSKITLY